MTMSEEQTKQRLLDLHNTRLLPQTTVEYLYKLRYEQSVYPGVIYDVGACVLHWTNEAVKVWPDKQFYCFEAMPEAAFLYDKPYIKGYHIGVLSNDDNKIVDFYQNTEHPGGNSYYKENVDVNPQADQFFNETHKRTTRTRTLDSVAAERGFPIPDLIKMDVQGAEMDILLGAQTCLTHAQHLLLELQRVEYNKGAPLREEVFRYLSSIGYDLVSNVPFSTSTTDGFDGDYHFIKR
ncbi:fkbM_fam, methyltransferase, FkbM family [uncultured Caudovirales phage]|uniref:FkbM_fam, methyltransferase, FkbM family n=1 Tax=uncultured Caudovirales phage TaxID=2100421 RepID=A0A6J7WTF7_9CAUD|nr:fkbM_fam, methyltransferase, FkbM family [uncultured Caudovirales phage]